MRILYKKRRSLHNSDLSQTIKNVSSSNQNYKKEKTIEILNQKHPGRKTGGNLIYLKSIADSLKGSSLQTDDSIHEKIESRRCDTENNKEKEEDDDSNSIIYNEDYDDEDEIKANKVTVKNLQTKEQKTVNAADILTILV